MSGRASRQAHGRPPSDGPAPFTTLVELTFQKQKVEHWIRFGRKSYERIIDRRRSVVGFAPDSVFAFVRWAADDHGTIVSRIDIVRAVRQRCTDQEVTFIQVDGDDAGFARIGKFIKRRFFHRAHSSGHEDIAVVREGPCIACQWQHHRDFFSLLQRKHVHNGATSRPTGAFGHFPNLEPVESPAIGKAQYVVVGVGNEELVNPIVLFGGRGQFSSAAAFLGAVF